MRFNFYYYFWATRRRKNLDYLQQKYRALYHGTVLDVGGRDRGAFQKPRKKVKKWIFLDIEKKHHPDIVADVADMKTVASESIDVVNAIELFEHVEKIEDGLKECCRVLKKNGLMIVSVPFLYPIHSDPYDYQRWTEEKWRQTLARLKLKIEVFVITGFFFTSMTDMIKLFCLSLPRAARYASFLFFPILDAFAHLDRAYFIKNNKILNKFHNGYFVVAKK